VPDLHQSPFFIRVLVPTADPDGMRIVEKSNWPGVGQMQPGDCLKGAKKSGD
jgi:hypothetical protein